MKIYRKYFLNVIRQGLSYRFNYFMRVVGSVVTLIVQYYIWKALLGNTSAPTSYGSIGFEQMLTYIVISSIMRVFMRCNLINSIDDKVRTGNIALDLIKPVNLKTLFFFDLLGETLFQMIFLLVPTMLIAICFWNFSFPPIERIAVFLVALSGSFMLYFLICYIIGILAFWFTQVWVLGRVLNDVVSFFSGALIPLWFFPDKLRRISEILPFQHIYFSPISIFTGTANGSDIMKILFMQWVWILIFYCIGKMIWNYAVQKITVLGG